MKNSICTLLIFTAIFSFAQERHRFELGTLAGYEYNYFKSPDELVVDGDSLTEEELIASSSFLDVFADYDYRFKKKGHRLRFSASPYARIFQENPSDSYWSLDAALKYDYRLSKNAKFLAELNFKRMNREGLDGAQDVLVNPLGYTNYGAASGFEFKPSQNNKTTVEGFYNFKNFEAFGIRDLEFNEYGGRVTTKQEFRPGRYEHAVGLTAYYKKRLYQTFNAEDNPQNGQRDWDYAKVTAFYEFPIGATIQVEPQLTYYGRFDRLANQSGFQQYGPGLRFKFDNDKTKVRASVKYQIRDYTQILAPGTQDLLRYTYTDFSLDFERELPLKGLYLIATAYSRFRETNTVSLTARSFRGYTNQYAGIGVRWKL